MAIDRPPAEAPRLASASDHAHALELFHALRRTPPPTEGFWDVAYGRARFTSLAMESIPWSWAEERKMRLLLALALVTPEPLLRARLACVTGPDGTIADAVCLVEPLLMARQAPAAAASVETVRVAAPAPTRAAATAARPAVRAHPRTASSRRRPSTRARRAARP